MRCVLAAAALMLLAPATAGADEPAVEKSVTLQHRSARGVPVWGPAEAPVTADFFLQLRSVYTSRDAYRALVQLQKQHPRRLRIAFRVWDAPSTGSYVAEAALEAHRQGRFFEFIDAYFRGSGVTRAKLADLCAQVGVDYGRVEAALAARQHVAALEENRQLASRLGTRQDRTTVAFNGRETPIAINSSRGRGDVLEEQYDRAYAQAMELLARGATLDTVYRHALRQRQLDAPPVQLPWGPTDGLENKRPKGPAPRRSSRLATAEAAAMARHGRGAEQPRVVINLFCSFQSINCGFTWDAIAEVMRVYGDQVYLQFNHLFDPKDSSQLSAESVHEAALCAEDQGAFWDFYDYHFGTVYGRQPRGVTRESLRTTAKSLGMDEDRFITCVENGSHRAEVGELRRRARIAGVRRTPSVIVNGRLYEGKFTKKPLLTLIADELRPGLLEQMFPVDLDAPSY